MHVYFLTFVAIWGTIHMHMVEYIDIHELVHVVNHHMWIFEHFWRLWVTFLKGYIVKIWVKNKFNNSKYILSLNVLFLINSKWINARLSYNN